MNWEQWEAVHVSNCMSERSKIEEEHTCVCGEWPGPHRVLQGSFEDFLVRDSWERLLEAVSRNVQFASEH